MSENIVDDGLLDVIRLALFECGVYHDDVEWMAEKIRRRIYERSKQQQSEFWQDFDPDEFVRFNREMRDEQKQFDDLKVGGTD